MDLPDFKQLKQLADTCRKSGIKTFKGFGMEFTLTDEAPVSTYKRKAADVADTSNELADESLSPEALLFWSTGGDSAHSSAE